MSEVIEVSSSAQTGGERAGSRASRGRREGEEERKMLQEANWKLI